MPNRKKPMTRQLHQCKQKFKSVADLKETIIKELCGNAGDVDVGYYHGRQSAKIWLISNEDLKHMYSIVKDEILIWAECSMEETSNDESEDEETVSTKKKSSTKRQKLEEETDKI